MRRRERIFPPNCTVCDRNPSRFLMFREKQRKVEVEYGFRLGVPCRTQEQRNGHRRYTSDWQRRYRAAHREEIAAYRRDYWLKVTKRGFDSKAESDGDEETLKRRAARKAARQKRAEYEERRQRIHEQYGFWLGIPPKTPEEKAGRARYRKEQDAARRERNGDRIAEYRKAHNAKRREENERKFLARLKRLEAKDPVAAEKLKARHEKLCRIQNMTSEERVLYRQQRQLERQQAQAERARKREEERRLRAERKAEEKRLRKPKVEKPRLSKLERMRLEQAKRRKERELRAAALLAAEREARNAYAAEREANRAAYLAAKAVKREEGTGKREEAGALHSCATTERPSVAPVVSVFADPATPTSSSGGDEPPKEPPIVTTGGDPPEDDSSPIPHPPSLKDAETLAEKDRKMRQTEVAVDKVERKKTREENRQAIREKYGFTPGKKPVTPEEIAGFKRWQRDQEAKYRERHRDQITAYNREYRRRKRAEALSKQQTVWTSEQWAKWEKRNAAKACPPGSPQWMVREVVKHIAAEQNLPEDAVMGRIIELGGLDFIIKGAESMGQRRCKRQSAVVAAARALALYLDPDNAEMFRKEGH